MGEPMLSYAHGLPGRAEYSRLGQVAFACAVASACGMFLTIFLIARPIPGPIGFIIHERIAPIFGVVIILLWLAGVVLGIAGLRQRERLRTFAVWALSLCGAISLLFLALILLRH